MFVKNIPAQIFHDPREQVRAVLGQDYITSVLQGSGLSRSIMILTNKRIYQRGKIFEFTLQGRFISSVGERVINIKDVTGTCFSENNQPLLKFMGIIAALAGIMTAINTHKGSDFDVILGVIMFILGISCLFLYFLKRTRFFLVEYAGGSIATNARWYSQEEMREFMRALSLVKDGIEKERTEDWKYPATTEVITQADTCAVCKKKVNKGAKFCGYCGNKIGDS